MQWVAPNHLLTNGDGLGPPISEPWPALMGASGCLEGWLGALGRVLWSPGEPLEGHQKAAQKRRSPSLGLCLAARLLRRFCGERFGAQRASLSPSGGPMGAPMEPLAAPWCPQLALRDEHGSRSVQNFCTLQPPRTPWEQVMSRGGDVNIYSTQHIT